MRAAVRRPSSSLAPDASQAPLSPDSLGEAELRLLRTFATTVAAGGLSAAAVELQLDLSTVSRQFRELEAWLGATLARRGRGGFALTPEGERLHALTRQFFGTMQALAGDLAAIAPGHTPVLRLGVVDALLTAQPLGGGADLPALLARLGDEVPGLSLHLHTLRPREIERELLAGALDAGILAANAPPAGLEQHLVYAETNHLYVGPGHPWHAQPPEDPTPAALQQLALVTDPYPDTIPHAGLRPLFAANPHTRADSIEAAALLVRSGRYAGYLPEHLVQHTTALAGLRAVCPARLSYQQDIVLCCRHGKADPVLRRLLRLLAKARR